MCAITIYDHQFNRETTMLSCTDKPLVADLYYAAVEEYLETEFKMVDMHTAPITPGMVVAIISVSQGHMHGIYEILQLPVEELSKQSAEDLSRYIMQSFHIINIVMEKHLRPKPEEVQSLNKTEAKPLHR